MTLVAPVEREAGDRKHVGLLRQLERQPAKLGGGPADLGNRQLVVGPARRQELGAVAAMGDGGRLVLQVEHARIAGGEAGVGRIGGHHGLFAVGPRRRFGSEGLGQIVNERHLRVRHADDIARLERVVALDPILAHDRAVTAVEVPQRPLVAGHEQLGVVPATALILDDDLVGRRPPDGHGAAGDQAKHVAPLTPLANHQIS
jgi:hypothetical protein